MLEILEWIKRYYCHPNIVHGLSKGMDLYSLGVLLLEIAY